MENTPNYIKNFTIDDMPNEDLKLVAELCGVNIAVELMKNLSGMPIYIPARPFIKAKKRYITEKFDGTTQSIKQLSKECEVTTAHVYDVLKGSVSQKKQV